MTALQEFPTERGFSDRYAVDRAQLRVMSTVFTTLAITWNSLGGVREVKNERIRREITRQELLQAWRDVVAKPAATRVETGGLTRVLRELMR